LRRSKASSASQAAEPAPPSLVEITITLSRSTADLVSELLFESRATAIAVSEESDVRLRTYLPDDAALRPALLRVRRYLSSLRALGIDPGPASVVTRRFRDRGWATRWKQFFRPMRIGSRLVVRPSWGEHVAGEDDVVVDLDPGMAFGTGQHPTTRFCLELLEQAFKTFKVDGSQSTGRRDQRQMIVNTEQSTVNREPAVLDLGTGSGLLAIAAFRFGAGAVLALDTDAVACRVASENIRRNRGDGRIVVKQGSLEAAGRRTFDLVLANLTAEQLVGLGSRLGRLLRPRGRLVASGILTSQERRVVKAFRRSGMALERVRRGRGWVGLMLRRDVPPPHGSS